MFTLPEMHSVQSGMLPRELQKKILFCIYTTLKSDLFFLSECYVLLQSDFEAYTAAVQIINYF